MKSRIYVLNLKRKNLESQKIVLRDLNWRHIHRFYPTLFKFDRKNVRIDSYGSKMVIHQ